MKLGLYTQQLFLLLMRSGLIHPRFTIMLKMVIGFMDTGLFSLMKRKPKNASHTLEDEKNVSDAATQLLEPEKKPRFADIQKTMFCMYQMAGECEGIDGSTEVLLMAQRELARRMENGVVWE